MHYVFKNAIYVAMRCFSEHYSSCFGTWYLGIVLCLPCPESWLHNQHLLYPMHGRGLLCKTILKTMETKLKAKMDNIKQKKRWYIKPRMHPGYIQTSSWQCGTWFSCDDQIKAAFSAKRSQGGQVGWIAAARDKTCALTDSHTLQSYGYTLSIFPICAISCTLG